MNDLAVLYNFHQSPNDETFTELFNTFTRQLISFFRGHRCKSDEAEDLAQEVMLKVCLKASQLRDCKAFRKWLFRIAKNALCEHHRKQKRRIETVTLEGINQKRITTGHRAAGSRAFEFLHWMAFLDARESEIMKLRFLEHWEYHEIAATKAIPIGTVQWIVLKAQKKLASHLTTRRAGKAA
jgi:RNA polymerase sigma factor (sigma-70 family)